MWRRPPALYRGGGPGRNFRRGIDFLENAGDPGHFQTWLARSSRAGVAVRELLPKHGAAPVDAGADSAQFHAKSFCVYSGKRLGPMMSTPMIKRTMNSGPLIPNTLRRLPCL